MQPEYSHRGRTLLLAVTLIALALQGIKLGSRGLMLHKWPTAGQWGQLALVVWLLISLWEGKAWARVVAALYYSLASVVGAAILLLMWSRLEPPLRAVSVLIVVLAGVASAILGFSNSLRVYMAARLTADYSSPDSSVAGDGPGR